MYVENQSREPLQAEVEQLRQRVAELEAMLAERSHPAALQPQPIEIRLEEALQQLQHIQAQLIQSEKLSSLGQMVAGVAHEINNPVNFIHGNIKHADAYTQDLLRLLELYQQHYPNPVPEIQAEEEAIDLEFLVEDLGKVLNSMKIGTDRIRQIVLSLRNFSRLDEADMKPVDIHEGIESTILILQNRFKATADHTQVAIVKEYGNLPLIECYGGQINQVFMNVLNNALDALEERDAKRSAEELKQAPSTICIRTELPDPDHVTIRITDNGPGMTEAVKARLFDPFFTTKAVGKGTGLGLSISHQIVTEKHKGLLQCLSTPGEGTAFVITIPIQQASS